MTILAKITYLVVTAKPMINIWKHTFQRVLSHNSEREREREAPLFK